MTPLIRRTLSPFAAVLLLTVLVTTANAASPILLTKTAAPPTYPHTSSGNRGVNVKALQHLLRHHGSAIAVTSVFDTATVNAVRAFQTSRGLSASGAVDNATWTALLVRLDGSVSGEAVIALTRLLNEKRLTSFAHSGIYTDPVRSAVSAFQGHMRISRTGVMGPYTWAALLKHYELPYWGKSMCDYTVGNGKANWGTASTIGQLQAAAVAMVTKGHGKIALGDIGFEHGGNIPGHQTHERGMDVDIRPMKKSTNQCSGGTNWRYSTYDRAATRDLVKAIRATAPGHVKLIYFNDPVLIREGLTKHYTGHDDHLHIRYCEKVFSSAAYDC